VEAPLAEVSSLEKATELLDVNLADLLGVSDSSQKAVVLN